MNIEKKIAQNVVEVVKKLYNADFEANKVLVQQTKKEFEGDFTIVTFAFTKIAGKSPEIIGQEIGAELLKINENIENFNIVKGFLNLILSKNQSISLLNEIVDNQDFGFIKATENSPLMMIEYSSPNTNKPLHLGHIRNNLLGYSIAEIQKANGYKVLKTNIVNDRGIHICKSMLAWQLFGNGETPENSGLKGDFLVGKYYVIFDKEYKKQINELISKGLTEEEAKKSAPLILDAQKMLFAWENGDKEVRELWQKMNLWVYAGFAETYEKLGVDFDKIYYESDTYLVGKQEVERGLAEEIFYKKPDGSVWADLTSDKLDEKLLLRADGTSVYMTQDIGTAKLRYNDFPISKMVYVVGNEQNYHFQVLAILLDKLGFEWGKSLVHFSYGMVELPEGKMKSREGTVVDADDLIAEMIDTAYQTSKEIGKFNELTENQALETARIIGLGALKYFILKVAPVKNMTFNPKESIDFNGNSAPFIQYTHARIKSVLSKAAENGIVLEKCANNLNINEKEKFLIQLLGQFPNTIREAGANFSPALIANYCYDLSKEFNQFYHDFSILKEENPQLKNFRLQLCTAVAQILKNAMGLLGIELPDKM
ncbi:MAG: arginine--tRNA ligase [Prevotellaceae bacterium]|jgi:arginyl-tRNA synthetase|nr:arginine--tRNA ligase [Prevotellaceae bacterium]